MPDHSRRTLLKGLALIPFIGPALARQVRAGEQKAVEKAFSAPVENPEPLHPLFGVQDAALMERDGSINVHTLRVGAPGPVDGKPRLTIQITKEQISQESWASLDEAEDALFAAFQIDVPERMPEPHLMDAVIGDNMMTNTIRINRVANLIAARTRRGAGNVVLVHRDDVAKLSTPTTNWFVPAKRYDQTSAGRIGRWTQAGIINDSITVWATDRLPPGLKPGYAFVGYRGRQEFDAPGIIARWQGRYHIRTLNRESYSLGDRNDYVGMSALYGPGEGSV